ncbi:MAG: hypothetical protein V3S00_02905, partial [Dehalococcoidia bacterium]
MRLDLTLHMRQEMRLKLAPQIIQSIEILQLPLLELKDRIDQELLENPLLEIAAEEETTEEGAEEAPPAEEKAEDLTDVEDPKEEPEGDDTEPLQDENYEAIEDILRQAEGEPYEYRPSSRSSDGEKDPKRAAIENSPAPDISLETHLRRQLALFDLAPDIAETCDNIIANLDWRGYLEHPLDEIVASMDHPVSLERAEEALAIV